MVRQKPRSFSRRGLSDAHKTPDAPEEIVTYYDDDPTYDVASGEPSDDSWMISPDDGPGGDTYDGDDFGFGFPRRQTVAERRAAASRELGKLQDKATADEGERMPRPLIVARGKLAKSPWGKAWCRHIAERCDYESRLPAGRSYLYSGAIIDMGIDGNKVHARVMGTRLYQVEVKFEVLDLARQSCIEARCGTGIESVTKLMAGEISDEALAILTDPEEGLFPGPRDMAVSCDCPDWASMCKHVAAVLYGLGYRIDEDPTVLFGLRGIDPVKIVGQSLDGGSGASDVSAKDLGSLFGIDLES